LEILIQNFDNFGKKFPNSEFFSRNFQNHRGAANDIKGAANDIKGAANDIKGAAASFLVNSKISIFNWESP